MRSTHDHEDRVMYWLTDAVSIIVLLNNQEFPSQRLTHSNFKELLISRESKETPNTSQNGICGVLTSEVHASKCRLGQSDKQNRGKFLII